MTISAAYSPQRQHNRSHRPDVRLVLLLIGLSVLLGGCIRPDATEPAPTVPALPGAVQSGNGAVTQGPPTLTPIPLSPIPTLPPSAKVTPIPPGLPLAGDGVWQTVAVGQESAILMFFHDSGGNACIRYIFRTTTVPRCAAQGQSIAVISGTLTEVNNKTYTIIAGRTLDGQVSGVSIEMSGNPAQSVAISNGGFVLVMNGAYKPVDVVPVNQYGNLVGGKVAF